MNKIDWSKFNGESFQLFCNTLLSFEISKRYIPFEAPGKDAGIDGWYEGNYDGHGGKWRFQFKFHSPETGRSASISILKTELKKDIINNITNEENLIFVTNVDVNPNQRKELLDVAKKAIDNKNIRFELWDGAKLNVLIAKYPLIDLWYGNNLKYLIQEYTEYFKEQLNAKLPATFTLANRFYYRENSIADIKTFITSAEKKMLIISGDAGIGKTRLCLEYFGRELDDKNDWIALTFTTHHINFELLAKALMGEKNYILLLDDAHRYNPGDISDLLELSNAIKPNKVKLILTTRNYYENDILTEVKEVNKNKVDSIKLKPFTKTETKAILLSELKGFSIEEHLNYFIELTYGKPIMIIALLNAIKGGIPLNDIKKDTFLTDYLSNHIKQISKKISTEYQINKKETEALINIFSLIEPIQIENTEVLNLISRTENIPVENVKAIFHEMKTADFIIGYYEMSIKPDLYSDIILTKNLKIKGWLTQKLPFYSVYLNNIIKNLNSTEASERDINSNYINNLLSKYISGIDSCDNQLQLMQILDTVYHITYTKPNIAVDCIEKFTSIYNAIAHPLHKSFIDSIHKKNYSLDGSINRVKNIIHNLSEIEDYTSTAFKLSYTLYKIIQDDGLSNNISSYDSRDYFTKYNAIRQNRILVECVNSLKQNDLMLCKFALHSINNLLKLEHTDFESDYIKSNSIVIRTTFLPENKDLKKLRLKCISALFSFYKRNKIIELSQETLEILLGIVPEIISARKHNYKGVEEIEKLFNILLDISKAELSLSQKQSIKDKIYWYKNWGIEKRFYSKIDAINNNLTKLDLTEQILDLFNPRKISEYKEEVDWQNTRSNEIIVSHPLEEIADSLLIILSQSKHQPYNLYFFLNQITNVSSRAMHFLDLVWEKDKQFVIFYCFGMLRRLYFEFHEKEFYWKYSKIILAENNQKARNSLLMVYDTFYLHDLIITRKEKNILTKEDADLIVTIFEHGNIDDYYSVSSALSSLFFIDKKTASKQIVNFLNNCNEKQFDDLLFRLEHIQTIFYKEISEIIFNHSIHLNPPYHLEKILNAIAIKEGFSEIYSYFLKRFQYKRRLILEQKTLLGYQITSTHSNHTIFNNIENEVIEALYIKIITWFIKQKLIPLESLYFKDFLTFFSPTKFVTPSIKFLYLKLLGKHKKESRVLINLAKSLSIYESKNDLLFDIILEILKISSKECSKDEQTKIEQECYFAATTMGLKSGIAGQPFQVDVELKNLLVNYSQKISSTDPKIRLFLKNILVSVQSDIDSNIDRGGELW